MILNVEIELVESIDRPARTRKCFEAKATSENIKTAVHAFVRKEVGFCNHAVYLTKGPYHVSPTRIDIALNQQVA